MFADSRRAVFITMLIGLSVCVSACSRPAAGGQSGATTPQKWTIPEGVLVTAADRGRSFVNGLYPSADNADPLCCWLAPDARIRFTKKRGDSHLVVSVYVNPDIAAYRAHPPYIAVVIGGRQLLRRDNLRAGENHMTVDLPPSMRGGAGPYEMTIHSSSIVPDRDVHNGDTRTLGLILTGIQSS